MGVLHESEAVAYALRFEHDGIVQIRVGGVGGAAGIE